MLERRQYTTPPPVCSLFFAMKLLLVLLLSFGTSCVLADSIVSAVDAIFSEASREERNKAKQAMDYLVRGCGQESSLLTTLRDLEGIDESSCGILGCDIGSACSNALKVGRAWSNLRSYLGMVENTVYYRSDAPDYAEIGSRVCRMSGTVGILDPTFLVELDKREILDAISYLFKHRHLLERLFTDLSLCEQRDDTNADS